MAIDMEDTPFSAYTEPFEQCFVGGATVRELSKKEEKCGWDVIEEKSKQKQARRRKDKGNESATKSIVRLWLRAGMHKSGQLMSSKHPKALPHSQNERMLTWRAMSTLASYDIMANPKYGRLLGGCPFFDEEKIRKARARYAKAERAKAKLEDTDHGDSISTRKMQEDPLHARMTAQATMKAAKRKQVREEAVLIHSKLDLLTRRTLHRQRNEL
jgi:hypothetical protein